MKVLIRCMCGHDVEYEWDGTMPASQGALLTSYQAAKKDFAEHEEKCLVIVRQKDDNERAKEE